MAAINKFFDWVARLALLNVLWLVFTVLGIGVFGLFPSLAATFTVTRKWVSGETDIPVVKTFWRSYKKEFIKSNGLGYIMALIGYILYLDFVFLTVSESTTILTIPFILITIIFLLTLLYVFPVFVYYDMKIIQVIKNSFFIMVLNPLPTFIMLLGTLGIGVSLWKFQGIIIFFGVSALSVAMMMPAYRAFQNVSEKKQLKPQKSN